MVVMAELVLLHVIASIENDIMVEIHFFDELVDYQLLHDSMNATKKNRAFDDDADIGNKKNHSALKVNELQKKQLLVDVYKIMDLSIAKMNYLRMYHSSVPQDKEHSHTFEVIHDDEGVQMDGSNIGET